MWVNLENTLMQLLGTSEMLYSSIGETLVQIICFVVCGVLIMLPFIIIYKVVEIISEGVN